MKFIITWIAFFYLTGCVTSPKILENEKILEKDKIEKKVIFTAEEYRKLPDQEKNTGELSISDEDLNLLEKPFVQNTEYAEYAIQPIKLSSNVQGIVNILKDSHFKQAYSIGNLIRFVYKDNKALGIFVSNNLHGDDKESGSGYCVGGGMYLFYFKNNEVQIKALGSFSGDIAPVEPPLIN